MRVTSIFSFIKWACNDLNFFTVFNADSEAAGSSQQAAEAATTFAGSISGVSIETNTSMCTHRNTEKNNSIGGKQCFLIY